MVDLRAASQRYLLGIWMLIGVLTPVGGFLGARGFAPAVGVAGLLLLGCLRPKGRDWIGFGLLALLAAWAFVSNLWSPAPGLHIHTLKDLEGFTGLHMAQQIVLSGAFVMSAAAMTRETARTAIRWLGGGLLVLAAILVEEGISQASLYQQVQPLIHETVRPDIAVRNVAQGGYVLAILLWPAAAAFWRGGAKPAAIFLIAAVIFSTFMLRGDSPTLAMAASAVVFAAVLKFGRPAVIVLLALTALYWLTTPMGMLLLQKFGVFDRLHGHLPLSWDRRLEIWTFTLARWLEDPFLGWGLDASRTFPHFIPLHPHDGALQMWFELGAPGAVLAAAFFGFLFWRIGEAAGERVFAATACATITVYLVIGAISFSLWQEWWVCLGAFALAACLALKRFIGETPAGPEAVAPESAGTD